MTQTLDVKRIYILILISFLFFFLGNNLISLTDPDEVFYSLTAKEMLLRHEWLTPYIFGHPQFEKPIFTYWLLLIAFKIGDITPWAARFFPALFAMFSVCGIYILAFMMYRDNQRAFWAGLILATSVLFVGLGKTVFTDMIFTTLILYALISFYAGFSFPRYKALAWMSFYFFCALATLTKGPLGFFIPALTAITFLIYRRRLDVLATPWVLFGFLFGLACALPWYLYMFKMYGSAFINEFFYNDHWRRVIEAEHLSNDRWYFYPSSMFWGMFPFSLFLLVGIKDCYKRLANPNGDTDHFILAWILVVFIIFQCAHSKLVSYILPMYPALALLTADVLTRKISKRLLMLNAGVLVLIGIGVMFAPYVVTKKIIIPIYPVYWISAGLITLGAGVYSCAIIGRERLGVYLCSATLMIVLIGGWFARDEIEAAASCAPASVYLPSKLKDGQKILASKPYARGISFYTNLPVVVWDPGGKGYFSPHPVTSFNNDKQLHDFLSTQSFTYAYLKKSAYEHVSQTYDTLYKIQVIREIGTNRLVKIEPLFKS